MNVSLTPELEKFVSDKVDSGRYTSASEVVREALRFLEEHDQSRAVQLAAFNKELASRLHSTAESTSIRRSSANACN
jgi:antitoxin ParD1/3/4